MPIYEYKGMSAKGKALNGVLDADSPRSLKERLFKDGIFLAEYVESRAGQETRRAGQKQAGTIGLKRSPAIGVARSLRQAAEISSEPFLLCAWRPRGGVQNKNRISCFIRQ